MFRVLQGKAHLDLGFVVWSLKDMNSDQKTLMASTCHDNELMKADESQAPTIKAHRHLRQCFFAWDWAVCAERHTTDWESAFRGSRVSSRVFLQATRANRATL